MITNDQERPSLMQNPLLRLGCTSIGGGMVLIGFLAGGMGHSPYFPYAAAGVLIFVIVIFTGGTVRYFKQSRSFKSKKLP